MLPTSAIIDEIMEVKVEAPSPTPARRSRSNTNASNVSQAKSQTSARGGDGGGSAHGSKHSVSYGVSMIEDSFHQPTRTVISPMVQVVSSNGDPIRRASLAKQLDRNSANQSPATGSPPSVRRRGDSGGNGLVEQTENEVPLLVREETEKQDRQLDHLEALRELIHFTW